MAAAFLGAFCALRAWSDPIEGPTNRPEDIEAQIRYLHYILSTPRDRWDHNPTGVPPRDRVREITDIVTYLQANGYAAEGEAGRQALTDLLEGVRRTAAGNPPASPPNPELAQQQSLAVAMLLYGQGSAGTRPGSVAATPSATVTANLQRAYEKWIEETGRQGQENSPAARQAFLLFLMGRSPLALNSLALSSFNLNSFFLSASFPRPAGEPPPATRPTSEGAYGLDPNRHSRTAFIGREIYGRTGTLPGDNGFRDRHIHAWGGSQPSFASLNVAYVQRQGPYAPNELVPVISLLSWTSMDPLTGMPTDPRSFTINPAQLTPEDRAKFEGAGMPVTLNGIRYMISMQGDQLSLTRGGESGAGPNTITTVSGLTEYNRQRWGPDGYNYRVTINGQLFYLGVQVHGGQTDLIYYKPDGTVAFVTTVVKRDQRGRRDEVQQVAHMGFVGNDTTNWKILHMENGLYQVRNGTRPPPPPPPPSSTASGGAATAGSSPSVPPIDGFPGQLVVPLQGGVTATYNYMTEINGSLPSPINGQVRFYRSNTGEIQIVLHGGNFDKARPLASFQKWPGQQVPSTRGTLTMVANTRNETVLKLADGTGNASFIDLARLVQDILTTDSAGGGNPPDYFLGEYTRTNAGGRVTHGLRAVGSFTVLEHALGLMGWAPDKVTAAVAWGVRKNPTPLSARFDGSLDGSVSYVQYQASTHQFNMDGSETLRGTTGGTASDPARNVTTTFQPVAPTAGTTASHPSHWLQGQIGFPATVDQAAWGNPAIAASWGGTWPPLAGMLPSGTLTRVGPDVAYAAGAPGAALYVAQGNSGTEPVLMLRVNIQDNSTPALATPYWAPVTALFTPEQRRAIHGSPSSMPTGVTVEGGVTLPFGTGPGSTWPAGRAPYPVVVRSPATPPHTSWALGLRWGNPPTTSTSNTATEGTIVLIRFGYADTNAALAALRTGAGTP